jgi:uncharacterized protein YcfJ
MKKRFISVAFTFALTAQAGGAWAATAPANTQLTADSKAAQARYDADKKLCNDETTSNARLQCRRDAKAEYDHAVAVARARVVASPAPIAVAPACTKCGRILSIAVTEKAGESSAVGVIAGGAVGAVLGNQVGGGFGKDLATLAGAAGGAYAGKIIEEKIKTHKVWSVTVLYANERKASFDFTNDPGLQVGDQVKNTGNTIARM